MQQLGTAPACCQFMPWYNLINKVSELTAPGRGRGRFENGGLGWKPTTFATRKFRNYDSMMNIIRREHQENASGRLLLDSKRLELLDQNNIN